MESTTILERALLGLTSLAPQSGYDVKQMFETSAMGQFSSSPGAIYPALRRLEERGLLASRSDNPDNPRARRVYSLTDEGEAALSAWLAESVTVEDLRNRPAEPFLRLTFSEGRRTGRQVLEFLDGLRHAVRALLNELHGQHSHFQRQGMLLPALVLEHGVAGYEATLDWIDAAENAIAARPAAALLEGRAAGS